jgi:hypothetical protein
MVRTLKLPSCIESNQRNGPKLTWPKEGEVAHMWTSMEMKSTHPSPIYMEQPHVA